MSRRKAAARVVLEAVSLTSIGFMALAFFQESTGMFGGKTWFDGRFVNSITFVEPNLLISATEFALSVFSLALGLVLMTTDLLREMDAQ